MGLGGQELPNATKCHDPLALPSEFEFPEAPPKTESHDLLALPTFQRFRSREISALQIDSEFPGFPREPICKNTQCFVGSVVGAPPSGAVLAPS